jgi:hypothetical protein
MSDAYALDGDASSKHLQGIPFTMDDESVVWKYFRSCFLELSLLG